MPEVRLFLERRSYRRRRIMDAMRMLPFFCALLWVVVPAMWRTGPPEADPVTLSAALWYVFSVWLLAITASFALWRRTRDGDEAESSGQQG